MTAEELMSDVQKRLIADGLGFYRTSNPLLIDIASFRERNVSVHVGPGPLENSNHPFVSVHYRSPHASEIYYLRNCEDIPSALVSVLNSLLLKHGLSVYSSRRLYDDRHS